MLKRKSAAGPAAGVPGLPALARRLEHAAPHEHALEVRRRDVVPERGRVDVAELAEREGLRREREADVRVRELRPEPLAAGERHCAVVERELRQPVDRMPVRVLRKRRVDAERNETEICGCELPLAAGAGRDRSASRAARDARAPARRPLRRGACGSTARASRRARSSRPGATRRRRTGPLRAARAAPGACPAAPERRRRASRGRVFSPREAETLLNSVIVIDSEAKTSRG